MAAPADILVAGTADTKGAEMGFVAERIAALGGRARRVDLATSPGDRGTDIAAETVAARHPEGAGAVFAAGDRGAALTAMAEAFRRFVLAGPGPGGVIGLGGSGGTALVTSAMRALPLGLPKLMISTVASGDIAPYVGASDIAMMSPVTDLAGLGRLSRPILANAAAAIAGMVAHPWPAEEATRPMAGLTMFGLTTPGVEGVVARLSDRLDCQVFHATGQGGMTLESLTDRGLMAVVVDLTTTEIGNNLLGGVCDPGPDRLGVLARRPIPWVGSFGACDMLNFAAPETVPDRYAQRRLHRHNANVTLMRTNADELAMVGRTLAERLNAARGPVRMLIPEHGLSGLDADGAPFRDPAADAALFDAFEAAFVQTDLHRTARVAAHINEARFAEAVAAAVADIVS